VFGISFLEIGVIAVVALVVVGPQKLPGMLLTLGRWIRKLRMLTVEMRSQSGIDDVLRQEGLHGGLTELRSLVRGDVFRQPGPRVVQQSAQPHNEATHIDPTREFPPEGVDAAGALPDDLVDTNEADEPEADEPEATSADEGETSALETAIETAGIETAAAQSPPSARPKPVESPPRPDTLKPPPQKAS
jgi:sec-independent protein translocase protein TatB